MIYTVALSIIKNIPIKQLNDLIDQTNDDKLLFTALSSRLGFKKMMCWQKQKTSSENVAKTI